MLAALLRMAALVTMVSASEIGGGNTDAILAQMLGVNKTTTNKDDARMQWPRAYSTALASSSSAVISETEGKTISETRVVSGVQYKRTIEYFRGDEPPPPCRCTSRSSSSSIRVYDRDDRGVCSIRRKRERG